MLTGKYVINRIQQCKAANYFHRDMMNRSPQNPALAHRSGYEEGKAAAFYEILALMKGE